MPGRNPPPHDHQFLLPHETSVLPYPHLPKQVLAYRGRTASRCQVSRFRLFHVPIYPDQRGMHVIGQTKKKLAAFQPVQAPAQANHGITFLQFPIGVIFPTLIHHIRQEVERKGRMHTVSATMPEPFQPNPLSTEHSCIIYLFLSNKVSTKKHSVLI